MLHTYQQEKAYTREQRDRDAFESMFGPELDKIAAGLKAMWWLSSENCITGLNELLVESEWTEDEQSWAVDYVSSKLGARL